MAGIGMVYGTGADAVVALEGVDLKVCEGESLCILGTSGGGK